MPAEPPGAASASARAGCTSWGSAAPGMSAIATVLAAMGHRVTGSDLRRIAGHRAAGRATASRWRIGHRPDNARRRRGGDGVAGGRPDNPELAEARRLGLPVLARAEVLAAIASTRRCRRRGRHPRQDRPPPRCSPSSSVEAGLRPSFLIGARRRRPRDQRRAGTSGEWMVLEADESYGTLRARSTPELDRAHQRRGRPPRPLRHAALPSRTRSGACST